MAHGVRKVNEYLIKDGRALIFTNNVGDVTKETWSSIENGSLFVEPEEGILRYKHKTSQKGTWEMFKAKNIIAPKTITKELITNYEIVNMLLADESVDTRTIKDSSIIGSKIESYAIIQRHLLPNSFDGDIFKENSIDGIKFITDSIDGTKIKPLSIGVERIKLKTLTGNQIADNSITDSNLITVDGKRIFPLSIKEESIIDATISAKKLKELIITNPYLADQSILHRNFVPGCVETTSVKDLAITGAKIANSTITNNKYSDLSIDSKKIIKKTLTFNEVMDRTLKMDNLETPLQNVINSAVRYDSNGVAIVKANLNVSGNIIASKNNLTQTITGFKVFNPVFKDFAEAFDYEGDLSEGDIVEISTNKKVVKAQKGSKKIIGVVSDSYAMCFGATQYDLQNGNKIAIGLVGQVNVKISGKISAGDMVVVGDNGVGKAICNTDTYLPGTVVGKALEDNKLNEIKQVLCLIHLF